MLSGDPGGNFCYPVSVLHFLFLDIFLYMWLCYSTNTLPFFLAGAFLFYQPVLWFRLWFSLVLQGIDKTAQHIRAKTWSLYSSDKNSVYHGWFPDMNPLKMCCACFPLLLILGQSPRPAIRSSWLDALYTLWLTERVDASLQMIQLCDWMKSC